MRAELPEGLRDAPASVLAGYSTYRVRFYTIFGIPYGEKSLGCDEQR